MHSIWLKHLEVKVTLGGQSQMKILSALAITTNGVSSFSRKQFTYTCSVLLKVICSGESPSKDYITILNVMSIYCTVQQILLKICNIFFRFFLSQSKRLRCWVHIGMHDWIGFRMGFFLSLNCLLFIMKLFLLADFLLCCAAFQHLRCQS